MLKQTEFRLLTLIAAATLLVALANIVLFSQNRDRQQEVTSRGQYIQQSVQLEGLYREIVKALADLAVRNNDKPIRDMLAAQDLGDGQPGAGGGNHGGDASGGRAEERREVR